MMVHAVLWSPPPVSDYKKRIWGSCSGGYGFIAHFPKDLFSAFGQFPPGQQNTMLTGLALQANIRPQTHHNPSIPATGVGFTQLDEVSQTPFRHQHSAIISSGML
jgi:hypothetical protein